MAAAYCVPTEIAQHVRRWLTGPDVTAKWIALELCGLRRIDPGIELTRLTSTQDNLVAARAFQLAAELGRVDLIRPILAGIADDGARGFWAAWAACLLGEQPAGTERLIASFQSRTEAGHKRLAAELLPLVIEQHQMQVLIRRLLENETTKRWAVVALGSFGAASTLDWLVRQMDDPKLARIAGASFALATGGRLGPNNLELDVFPEAPDDDVVTADPQEEFIESNLYWPDRAKVEVWLSENRNRFRPDTRHLLGQAAWTHIAPPADPAKYQLEFRAIALELALRKATEPLPNWRAPVILAGGHFRRLW